ncbi:MAG TPA: beta-ketoacyl-ACP synthase III [Gemmatimonadales bacterium]|nr:beta-ketoacyl-ACP synthase III [Gemmatimonadales bacterium]
MPRSIILGTGSFLPERVVTNDDLSKFMDTSDEWIRQRTGIQSRHWVTEGTTQTSMALAACQRAMAMAKLEAKDIDAIVYATSTPDHFAPGNGVYLQQALGAREIPAMDIRNQCSGFVYALSVADAWIQVGLYQHVLVVGAEIQSTSMDLSTAGRNVSVIFADGAAAVVLGPTDDPKRGILGFDLHSEGQHAELLWVDAPGSMYHPRISKELIDRGQHWLQMDGKEVFKHAVTRMPESVLAVLAKAGQGVKEMKLLVPHQANLRISEMIQKRLELRDDQVVNNIQTCGNTTAATIPLALDEVVRAGRLQPGDLVVFTAFGSGFAWGSCALRW